MQYILSWDQKLYRWLCTFLLVQLFINLITWPLFLGWGLPITPLSIIGNLIFSPFLTAFLIVSSLIVTADLLALPSGLFCSALEQLSSAWLWLVQCQTPDCMITFISPPLPLALCAPLGATYIIMNKKIKTDVQKIGVLSALYCILMFMFSLHPKIDRLDIPYGSKNITVLNKNEKLTLIDPGFTRRTSGINQWINYTLLPELGRNFGRQTVDNLILKKHSPSAHACAQTLRMRGITKKITASIEDGLSKTKPSFHAAPLSRSKNPSYRNRSCPQSQELHHALRK